MHLPAQAQVLPEGLVVPPAPYLAALAVAVVAVGYALARVRPAVTEHVVLAAAPWMVVGGGVHAVHQFGLVPAALAPLTAAPAVYVTTALVAGAVWAAGTARADEGDLGSRTLARVGGGALVALVAVTYAYAYVTVPLVALAWPVVCVIGAAIVGGPVYYLLWTRRRMAAKQAGVGGAVVVAAHALDGVSTAVGVDLLGTGERSPIPAAIMRFAGDLPTAPYLGSGWLFVLVKLAVAAVVVLLVADYVEDEPAEGNLLMTVVAAVGLGPAANNLVLFMLSGVGV
jgi:uncharacterized membrane protein